jgi:hypothetical protein
VRFQVSPAAGMRGVRVCLMLLARNAVLFLGQSGFNPVKESTPVQALCSHAML